MVLACMVPTSASACRGTAKQIPPAFKSVPIFAPPAGCALSSTCREGVGVGGG